ncbi:MAG: hypothetical protein GF353_09665 [Candidatus Lokiarchaeota archaeon]|nr:hypothetical protein [Candidatus Lokiarchaeota archaeon]
MVHYCLTIAGSDPSSGAGVQADIRTFDNCGVHPLSVITALTYQTATDFYGYTAVSEEEMKNQLEPILENYPVEYVKTGMIPNEKILSMLLRYVKKYNLKVITDPVTLSSAGKRLSTENMESIVEKKLIPNVVVLTPNVYEAEIYSHKKILVDGFCDVDDIIRAGEVILDKMNENSDSISEIRQEKAVLIKSGPIDEQTLVDALVMYKKEGDNFNLKHQLYKKKKLNIDGNVHGTGCVFSSSIAAFLSRGNSLEKAIDLAEEFFNEKFQHILRLSDEGKVIDLTVSEQKMKVINEIKRIYNFFSSEKIFSKLIPEVRTNISCSLPNASKKDEIAGIEGRITIINGYPQASGNIKFNVSDHTARLILTAKQFDSSINIVINLKYKPSLIEKIEKETDLKLYEFVRERQPNAVKKKEHSTMQFLIEEYINKTGERVIPDIIWDNGAKGKEPMIRLFGKNSKDIIKKLKTMGKLLN